MLSGILTVVPIIPSDSIFKYPGLICLWVVKWLLWLSVFLRTVYNDHINTVQNIILTYSTLMTDSVDVTKQTNHCNINIECHVLFDECQTYVVILLINPPPRPHTACNATFKILKLSQSYFFFYSFSPFYSFTSAALYVCNKYFALCFSVFFYLVSIHPRVPLLVSLSLQSLC